MYCVYCHSSEVCLAGMLLFLTHSKNRFSSRLTICILWEFTVCWGCWSVVVRQMATMRLK